MVALPSCDMADDDQYGAGAEGTDTIASQVASICAMIDEHEAGETPMSAWRVAAISGMIDDVADAATAASERRTISKMTSKLRHMRSTRCYEDLYTLGEGTTAVVTKARHLTTGQTVAMKTIHEGEAEACLSVHVGELLREACFMAACRGNPSVVDLHGVARAPGTKNDYSLVMEHAGTSLDRVLGERVHRTGRPFSEPEACRVMRQLLSGAAAMHEHGIVHRDIKTENVLVDSVGNVKIGDFGSAMSVEVAEKTGAGAYWSAGTTQYSAPEMLMETPGYDARVDAWSVGCVMVELLIGEVLFNGNCDSDQLYIIYDVLGVPGKKAWRPYESSFVAGMVPLWRQEQQQQRREGRWHGNLLRELFPEEVLSDEGFKVLKGLLTCNPDERLTAAAALQLPWFADNDNAPTEN
uniref:Uncharacterized protein n=1 Tax=Avena sativa TaxID=4498 RepID=A0ACD5XBX8_AVESA